MELLSIAEGLLLIVQLAPLFLLNVLIVAGIVGHSPSELFVRRLFGILSLSSVFSALGLVFLIHWYSAPATLVWGGSTLFQLDAPGSLFLAVAVIIIGVAGNFSLTYLHRDVGFNRYFVAYAIFYTGICQVFAANHTVLFMIGWECVGISSAMLIAYFQERDEPVRNSRFTFGFYRIGDIGILAGIILLSHSGYGHLLPWLSPPTEVSSTIATIGLWSLAFGAGVKMSLLPFASWLPRAMEGPTPSSAVYYGALAVNMGAFLLWRIAPKLLEVDGAGMILIIFGLSSAAFAAICGRARTDVKTQLAFGSLAQLGLICVEIGFGWQLLALWHILGNMSLRTLQFLTGPSVLHAFHTLGVERASAQGGFHWERLLPQRVQSLCYRWVLAEFHLQDFIAFFLVRPVYVLADTFLMFDRAVMKWLRAIIDVPQVGLPALDPTIAVNHSTLSSLTEGES